MTLDKNSIVLDIFPRKQFNLQRNALMYVMQPFVHIITVPTRGLIQWVFANNEVHYNCHIQVCYDEQIILFSKKCQSYLPRSCDCVPITLPGFVITCTMIDTRECSSLINVVLLCRLPPMLLEGGCCHALSLFSDGNYNVYSSLLLWEVFLYRKPIW